MAAGRWFTWGAWKMIFLWEIGSSLGSISNCLVVYLPTPLKNIGQVSWDDSPQLNGEKSTDKYWSVGIIIPNIWRKKTCSKPPSSKFLGFESSVSPLRFFPKSPSLRAAGSPGPAPARDPSMADSSSIAM